MTQTPLSAELQARAEEDFKLLVLCNMKGNMDMYGLLRDKTLQSDIAEFRKNAVPDAQVTP